MSIEATNFLRALGCEVALCGSRVTCAPPPTDSDHDYLVVVPQRVTFGRIETDTALVCRVHEYLTMIGFRMEGGGEHYQMTVASKFVSFRRGEFNLIVTANADFAKRHRVATALCTRLNLMHKPDRIALFQAVLYGEQR